MLVSPDNLQVLKLLLHYIIVVGRSRQTTSQNEIQKNIVFLSLVDHLKYLYELF